VKAYADGSLGSATAYFFEKPFSDQRANRGLLSDEMQPISLIARFAMMRADALDCRSALTLSETLEFLRSSISIQRSEKAHGSRDRRWRIEHAQHMAAKDFDRFASTARIASVQPITP